MHILNSKYKHIIWDWNGTLLDDVNVVIRVMNSLLKKRNMTLIDKDTYREIFNFPVINYYSQLGFDFSIESFEKISNEYIELYRLSSYECNLHQDAEIILQKITKAGITQSILSASQQEYLEHFIDFYKIREYFIQLIGLDNHFAESKIEKGKKWLSELPHDSNEVLLIGDTIHDYEVSRALNCDCILVDCGHQRHEKLIRCGVTVCKSLNELYQLL